MKLIFLLFTTCFLFSANNSFGQEVEHNYSVGPQQTDCDSLQIDGYSKEEAIQTIKLADFRFDQSFSLSRKNGLQSGAYYSCDHQAGFMIIKYDGMEYLYKNVAKSLWNDLISSTNPEDFYIGIKYQLDELL